ncbi:MAG: MFS transporter [Actinomycetota bacterium]
MANKTVNRIKQNQILVFGFSQLLVLSVSRLIIGPLIPLISEELKIGLDFIGSAISVSIFPLFLVSLSAGNLIELIGLKKVLYIGLGMSIAGSMMLYFSHSFPTFMVAYLLLQSGFGVLVIGNFSIIGSLYPTRKTSSLIKLDMGVVAGFVIAPIMVSLMLFIKADWRNYYLFSLILLFALVVILWKLKVPRAVRIRNDLKTLFMTNKSIISNNSFVMCGMIIFFYASVMNTFFMWFTSYFQNVDIEINISSLFLAIYGVAIFIGMMLRGKLIKHFKEKGILLFGFIASLCLLIGILFIQDLIFKNILIFLFGITIAGNFPIVFSIGSGLFPEYANSVSGLMVAFANLGTMVFQYLSGYFSEYYSKNSVLYINIAILLILIILTSILNYYKKFK